MKKKMKICRLWATLGPPPPLAQFVVMFFLISSTLSFQNLVVCNFVGGGCARYGRYHGNGVMKHLKYPEMPYT